MGRPKKRQIDISVREEQRNALIKKMRLLRERGYSSYKIANTFGVPNNEVYPFIKDVKPKSQLRQVKIHLTEQELKDIQWMNKEGFSPDQIARFLNVTEICVLSNMKRHSL